MRRYPITRILFLFFTCFAVAVAPTIYKEVRSLETPPTKAQQPIAGQNHPIAGQENGDDTGIVLRAPDEAEIGELVRLDASSSDVDSLTWQIIPATPDFEVIEDGRRAFFSSRVRGSYLIIIGGAKDQQALLRHHTIDVLGDAPEPGPENLSVRVRRWTKAVKDYEGREAQGLALAGVFRKLGLADDITVDQMLEATATANSAVLGDNLEKWLPLLEPLGRELDLITADGGLSTREQYKDIWLKIAEGIEKGV